MREVYAETDTRLPTLERAHFGARGSVFASPEVRGLYERLFTEAWLVEVNPGRFRSHEARLRALRRTAGILGDLEAAVCREVGTDRSGGTRPRRPGSRAECAVNPRLGG